MMRRIAAILCVITLFSVAGNYSPGDLPYDGQMHIMTPDEIYAAMEIIDQLPFDELLTSTLKLSPLQGEKSQVVQLYQCAYLASCAVPGMTVDDFSAYIHSQNLQPDRVTVSSVGTAEEARFYFLPWFCLCLSGNPVTDISMQLLDEIDQAAVCTLPLSTSWSIHAQKDRMQMPDWPTSGLPAIDLNAPVLNDTEIAADAATMFFSSNIADEWLYLSFSAPTLDKRAMSFQIVRFSLLTSAIYSGMPIEDACTCITSIMGVAEDQLQVTDDRISWHWNSHPQGDIAFFFVVEAGKVKIAGMEIDGSYAIQADGDDIFQDEGDVVNGFGGFIYNPSVYILLPQAPSIDN